MNRRVAYAAVAVGAAGTLPILEAARDVAPGALPPIWPVPLVGVAAAVAAFGAHGAATGSMRPRSVSGAGGAAAVFVGATAVGLVGIGPGLLDPFLAFACVAFGVLPVSVGAGIVLRKWRTAASALAAAVGVAVGGPVLVGGEPLADALVNAAVVVPGFVAGLVVTVGNTVE